MIGAVLPGKITAVCPRSGTQDKDQPDRHRHFTAERDDPIFGPSREQVALGTVPLAATHKEQETPMEQRPDPKTAAAGTETERNNEAQEPTFGSYCPEKLGFNPTKDLNLPSSYDEVVKRFNRLQGDRAMEVLN
jgi:hypothetical protein